MKKIYYLLFIIFVGFALTGCVKKGSPEQSPVVSQPEVNQLVINDDSVTVEENDVQEGDSVEPTINLDFTDEQIKFLEELSDAFANPQEPGKNEADCLGRNSCLAISICFNDLAKETLDYSLCEKLPSCPGLEEEVEKTECQKDVAKEEILKVLITEDYNNCFKLKGEFINYDVLVTQANYCLQAMGVRLEDKTICEYIKDDKVMKEDCIFIIE